MSDLHFVNETEWDASDFRKVFEAFNEGVVDLTGGDLEVVAGGTGLSVDVAAGVGFVEGDTDPDQGLYRVVVELDTNSDAFLDGGLDPAHATLPRFDRIIARVYDDEIDSSGDTDFRLQVLTGTPTSGATLANENGAAALPGTAMLLANVLVPAAATSLDSGDLEDQRISALSDIAAGGPHHLTHEIGGTDEVAGLVTSDQKDALDAANAPDAANAVATMDDLTGLGGGSSNAPEILARDTPETFTIDDFSTDTEADYDGPVGSLGHWAVAAGVFGYDGASGITAVLHDTPQLDGWVGFKFRPSAGVTNAPTIFLKALSQTSPLSDAMYFSHNPGDDLTLWIDGDSYNAAGAATVTLTPGDDYWLLAKLDGNLAMAGLYDADPIANPETVPLTYAEIEIPDAAVTLYGDEVSGYVGWLTDDGVDFVDDFVHGAADAGGVSGPPIAELVFDGATVEDLGFRRARITPTGGGGIAETLIDAKGDLIAGDAADSAVRVAIGTDGKVLTADSAAASGVSWQTPASGGLSEALLDAVGDLIVASADNTAARLAKGTNGQVLTVDTAEALDLKWSDPALVLPERDVATYTTGSLADDAAETGVIALAKSFRLLQIDTDVAARVQLYATPGDRTADAARPIGTDPTGDHGVILDFATTPGDTSWRFAPVVDGSSMEVSPSSSIAMRVTNISGSTDTVTVDLIYLATEQ